MEKKCPHCTKWTHWNGKLDDRCEHCDTLLQERSFAEKAEWHAREAVSTRSDFFLPKETDGPLMFATRKVALFFHVVFGAIGWFFIWSFINAAA